MKKRKKKLSNKAGSSKSKMKAGLPPGTLVHVGEELTTNRILDLISYNKAGVERYESEEPKNIFKKMSADKIHWINLDGLQNIDHIEAIGKHFHLHPLILEDILNTDQRPKSEEHDDYIFFTLKTLNKIENQDIIYEQVSFILGKGYLLSFQERDGDHFDGIRERMKLPDSKMRNLDIDYLFYRLIDTIVDSYYSVMEHIGERLEELEEEIYLEANEQALRSIQDMKKELIFLRKSVYPLREAIKTTMTEPKLISENTRKYFADVYDHTVQMIETIESYRDFTASLIDTYMTMVSNKMNEVMQVLTIIATIFIPLTFIAGVYGMNFENMPELGWKYGYPAVWGIMIITTLIMIIFFRKKKWL